MLLVTKSLKERFHFFILTLDPVSHIPVEISVANKQLYARMFVIEDELWYQRPSLLSDKPFRSKWVLTTVMSLLKRMARPNYTIVQLGVRLDNKYEIVSGLNAGDRVIIEGQTDLVDGTAVDDRVMLHSTTLY